MNMSWYDWSVVFVLMAALPLIGKITKRYTRSTADFLAANRSAGRYMLTLSEGMAGLGAVGIIGNFQMGYKVGFASNWWANVGIPVSLLLMVSGWVIYRYRETRVLTLAQLFEVRYSRRFRTFAAIIMWISGILNFGIFPAAGANFFISYCGLAPSYPVLGLALPTYEFLLLILIGVSLYLTLSGGQIAVLVTDFFQAFFFNVLLLTTLLFLLGKFPLGEVFEGLLIAAKGKSMVNPFDAGRSQFSAEYFLIGVFSMFFQRLAWQGSAAYHVSGKSPHEAKMAGVLGSFRGWAFCFSLTLIPLVAYMIMHHPSYAAQAQQVKETLSGIENPEIRDQMLVPVTMTLYMPVGIMGAFAAAMFAAFVSTHDTYMHSWGSLFVQDIIMPLRKKAFTPRGHLLALRLSIAFVALFIFLWSCWFRQTMHILFWFALTGAFWLGGAGVVIIGALYTRWGTTRGAYAALITGSVLATTGMVLDNRWNVWYGKNFFLNGQHIYGIAIACAVIMYTLFSLIGKRTHFDLDKLLHRGKYIVEEDHARPDAAVSSKKWNWKQVFGITKDFTRGDKIIYGLTYANSGIMFSIFVIMICVHYIVGLTDHGWANFHYYFTMVYSIGIGFIIAIWLTLGGIRDVYRLFRDLKTAKRDFTDDGRVVDHDYEEPAESPDNGEELLPEGRSDR